MGQNNIIELNGKQYDAITGAFLGESQARTTPVSHAGLQHRGRAIDGVVRGAKQSQALAPTVIKPSADAPKVAQPSMPSSAKRMDIKRAPKQIKAHQPQRAKTLMRHAVSKPQTEMKTAIKTAGPTEMMAKPKSDLAKPLEKKLSVSNVDPVRLARSRQVARSHHIRRYHQPRAERQQQPAIPAQALRPQQKAAQPIRSDVRPAQPAAVSQPVPAKQHVDDIFEAALAHATSHEQPMHRTNGRKAARKRRFVGVMAGIAAFLVLGGFLAYLNMPAIELRVASMQAGFHASKPSYQPTGYSLDGGVKSAEGRVEMTYRSGDSAYKITQVASDWNSATLLDQNTEQRGAPKKTIQSKGRIIYIYDNTASWVNGGVRYEIKGNAALDSQELVSLATSM